MNKQRKNKAKKIPKGATHYTYAMVYPFEKHPDDFESSIIITRSGAKLTNSFVRVDSKWVKLERWRNGVFRKITSDMKTETDILNSILQKD